MTQAPTDAGRRGWAVVGLLAALLLPLVGLAVLIGRPELDVRLEHHPIHFWLVLGTAGVNVALAYATNEAADRRADARLILVSLAFLLSAGFLGLHALATPAVLLPEPNTGFVIATPVGLILASLPAAASVSPIAGPRSAGLLRHRALLRWAVIGFMLAWGVASILRLPPLGNPAPEEIEAWGVGAALVAVALYAVAAWRYFVSSWRRPSAVALAIVAAFILLAEAVIAVALSRSWHLSWWEWHVLMTVAFALIALGTRAEYRRTGSLVAAFAPIYLQATLARIDRWHGRAIADLADAETRGQPTDRLLADLRADGASTDELRLMTEAAREIRRVDELFRPYLPQRYAERLRSEPGLARPGGEERTVSVLFADLAGFTTFSEQHEPTEVIGMLNEYWGAGVPVIDASGGAIEHFAGDGVLVLFNALVDQPDHAARAVRCGLDLIAATDRLAATRAGWPRFRAGVNTGPAVVGTVGAAQRRSFATIGDTTNLGSRLMSAGEPGEVVVSRRTYAELDAVLAEGTVRVRSLGRVRLKGKRDEVEAWALGGMA